LIKNILRIGFLTTALLSSHQANSTGIPVVDAAHISQTATGWANQVASMAKEFVQMKQQYDMLTQQFNNLNGVTDLGSLVNNPALKQYLPSDYQAILNAGYGNSSAIRAATKITGIENTSLNPNSDAAKLFEANAIQASLNRATAEAGYKQASDRFSDIQVLLDKINTVPDAKDMADLQARIQVEQVMMQNETNKLAMLGQLAQAQRDLANQKAVEIGLKANVGTVPRF
jgi:type IV secretion system protein VirB5